MFSVYLALLFVRVVRLWMLCTPAPLFSFPLLLEMSLSFGDVSFLLLLYSISFLLLLP